MVGEVEAVAVGEREVEGLSLLGWVAAVVVVVAAAPLLLLLLVAAEVVALVGRLEDEQPGLILMGGRWEVAEASRGVLGWLVAEVA